MKTKAKNKNKQEKGQSSSYIGKGWKEQPTRPFSQNWVTHTSVDAWKQQQSAWQKGRPQIKNLHQKVHEQFYGGLRKPLEKDLVIYQLLRQRLWELSVMLDSLG